jgi:hypothetical protein
MRTTVTLDEDVAAKVRAEMRNTGLSFKQAINQLIRRAFEQKRPARKRFRVKAKNLGLKPGYELDNIGELLEQVEGPDHR